MHFGRCSVRRHHGGATSPAWLVLLVAAGPRLGLGLHRRAVENSKTYDALRRLGRDTRRDTTSPPQPHEPVRLLGGPGWGSAPRVLRRGLRRRVLRKHADRVPAPRSKFLAVALKCGTSVADGGGVLLVRAGGHLPRVPPSRCRRPCRAHELRAPTPSRVAGARRGVRARPTQDGSPRAFDIARQRGAGHDRSRLAPRTVVHASVRQGSLPVGALDRVWLESSCLALADSHRWSRCCGRAFVDFGVRWAIAKYSRKLILPSSRPVGRPMVLVEITRSAAAARR